MYWYFSIVDKDNTSTVAVSVSEMTKKDDNNDYNNNYNTDNYSNNNNNKIEAISMEAIELSLG